MNPRVARRRLLILCSLPVIGLLAFWIGVVNPTWQSSAPVRTASVSTETLRKHVAALTSLPQPRQSENKDALAAAAEYIRATWAGMGLAVQEQPYRIGQEEFRNLIVSLGPADGERIIVGAHYDVCGDRPGADDNASGVAGVLELTRLLKTHAAELHRRIDLVAYSTEEPPYFGSHDMGSWIHAKSLRDQHVTVRAMFSLEMIGYFADAPSSQKFPMPIFNLFYPTRGDFLVLVGRFSEWDLTRTVKPLLQQHTTLPVYSANAPTFVPGVDWSDHRSYWEAGYPAFLVTDTSFLRNSNYHQSTDTIETLDFPRMAQVVSGVYGVVTSL